jgi:tetratricopeptide (TPR) repeat protein
MSSITNTPLRLERLIQHRHRPQLVAALILACGLTASYLALAQGYPGAFLLDDRARIMGIDVTSVDLGAIYKAILEANSGLLGRPVSLFSLYLTKGIYGENPAAFRYENILYHLLTGILLCWMLGRLFTSRLEGQPDMNRIAWPAAAGLAAIWLIHPLHVSTALYTVQRMTQLSTIFTICALLCYIIGRQQLIHGKLAPIAPFALLPLFILLGILSKEDAALVPVYLLLLEVLVFRGVVGTKKAAASLKVVIGLFIAAPLILGTIYFALKIGPLMNDYLMREFTLGERIATELVVVWKYVAMLLLPRLSSMSLFHDSIPVLSFSTPSVIVAGIGWLATAIVALLCMRRLPLVALGIALFLAAHMMESTIIPLELMFEHRNYFASIGVFLAAFGAITALWPHARKRVRVFLWIAVGSFTVILVGMQGIRADSWKNEAELLLVTAEEHPESVRTKSMLANELLQSGHIRRAQQILQSAIDANQSGGRNLAGMHLHLLLMHCYERSFPAELYEKTKALISTRPMNAYVLSGLKALQKQIVKNKCPAIPVDSMIELNIAAAENDQTRERYRFLAKAMAGSILGGHGDMERARPYLESALEHQHRVPTHLRIDTLTRLAEACLYTGAPDCAQRALTRADRLLASAPLTSALTDRNERLDIIRDHLETIKGPDAPMQDRPAPERDPGSTS